MLVLVRLGFMITRIVFQLIPSEFLRYNSTIRPDIAANKNRIKDNFKQKSLSLSILGIGKFSKQLCILSLSPSVVNMIVIPNSTRSRMSFPFEEPIRIGWENGLMNWSMPLRKYSEIPKMIRTIPNGMYLLIF